MVLAERPADLHQGSQRDLLRDLRDAQQPADAQARAEVLPGCFVVALGDHPQGSPTAPGQGRSDPRRGSARRRVLRTGFEPEVPPAGARPGAERQELRRGDRDHPRPGQDRRCQKPFQQHRRRRPASGRRPELSRPPRAVPGRLGPGKRLAREGLPGQATGAARPERSHPPDRDQDRPGGHRRRSAQCRQGRRSQRRVHRRRRGDSRKGVEDGPGRDRRGRGGPGQQARPGSLHPVDAAVAHADGHPRGGGKQRHRLSTPCREGRPGGDDPRQSDGRRYFRRDRRGDGVGRRRAALRRRADRLGRPGLPDDPSAGHHQQ